MLHHEEKNRKNWTTKLDNTMVVMVIMTSVPEKDVGDRLLDCQIRNVSLPLHSYLAQTHGCCAKYIIIFHTKFLIFFVNLTQIFSYLTLFFLTFLNASDVHPAWVTLPRHGQVSQYLFYILLNLSKPFFLNFSKPCSMRVMCIMPE